MWRMAVLCERVMIGFLRGGVMSPRGKCGTQAIIIHIGFHQNLEGWGAILDCSIYISEAQSRHPRRAQRLLYIEYTRKMLFLYYRR